MNSSVRPDREKEPESTRGPRRRVLVVDGNPVQKRQVGQFLRPLACEIIGRTYLGDIEDNEFDLVITGYDSLTDVERAALVRQFRDRNKTPLLVLSSKSDRAHLATMLDARVVTNFIARSPAIDPQELIVTVQKMLRRDVFGMEKYFAWGVEPTSVHVHRSSQKAQVLRRAESYVTSMGLLPRLTNLFLAAADEFVTNALYNAPLDANGVHRFAHLARTEEAVLVQGEEVVVRFCCDGRRLGISITDPFGSITPARILEYLAKCYRGDALQVDDKPGGAGLGLYYIFDAVSHFVVNIAPRKKTEMIGLIELDDSYRKVADRGKAFNIFLGEHG